MMQHKLDQLIKFVLLLLVSLIFAPVSGQVFPDDAWGVYTWASYNTSQVTPAKTPLVKGGPITMHWSSLEPQNGKFEFDKHLGAKLEQLYRDGFYTHIMIWVAPATTKVTETDTTWNNTPKWLFHEGGVPLVAFPPRPDPLGNLSTKYFPYYLHENYKFHFHRLIAEFGKYVQGLPAHLRERILFVQSAEGSTGDGQGYKGDPIDPQYNITKDQWSAFRIETWEKYVEAFSQDGELLIPLLTNYDSNREEQYNWMLDNLPKAAGLKNGMFSHGYHISEAQERIKAFNRFRDDVEAQGKVFFARGEQDAEYKTYGWSTQNIPQGLYWSGIYATHCGLTLWNVPTDACQKAGNQDALIFFNRHAAQFHPETATHAFCALRRGLDASDTRTFPVSTYGAAEKSNVQRYINIANAFSSYGAIMGDPEKATGGGMINRKREDYNDAGWQILPGNYQRHITQMAPEETSLAWWSVDMSVYGRFARGFDVANNKNTMYFDVHDKYFSSSRAKGDGRLKVKIIHYAKDGGSWELQYHAQDGSMKSIEVVNDASKDWVITEFDLTDAILINGGEKGADLILQNKGNTSCRFHLIELVIPGSPAAVGGVSIKTNTTTPLAVGGKLQLEAEISPANAGNTDVKWEVVAGDAVTVDPYGLLTAIAEGTAIVNVTTRDGGFSDSCAIKVGETNYTLENVPGLNFDIEDQTAMYKDTTETSEENDYYKIKGFNIKWNTLSDLIFDVENSGLAPGEGVNSSQAFKMKFSGARGTGTDMVLITELVDISDREPGDYVFTFSAKSLVATSGTPINLVVNTYDADGTNITSATCIRNERIVSLTSDYKTQSISFTVNANTSGGNDAKYAKLTMQSGKYDNTYWFDNFKLTAFVDAVIPPGLSGIKIDSVPFKWFHPEIYNYDVELPYGTVDLPVVTADTTESVDTISISNITSLPGAATVHATFNDGSDATYTINFSVSDRMPSADADLLDLKVNGIMVAGFDASVTEYNVALPYVTVYVPDITATASNENASVEISGTSSLPGSKIIKVSAEDGTTTKTYTINFTVAPSFDASLSGLSINDTTVTDFSASKEVYDIELPEGTTDVPVVRATATDENATVSVNNAPTLPGTASILVTAEDGVTSKTYTINFTVADPVVSIDNLSVSNTDLEKVFPNPANEFLNVEFATRGRRKIELFNSVGHRVFSVQTSAFSTEIDLKALKIKGILVVQIKTDNSVTNHKVIVTH